MGREACMHRRAQNLNSLFNFGVSTALLLRDQASQKLWSEVGTVRPADGAKLRIQVGLFELIGIEKRFKHWTCQLRGQVHFSMGAIVKLKGKRMP